MIALSSLRPVCGVTDWLRWISLSTLIPSGVISNTQAKTSTPGNPSATSMNSVWITQLGILNWWNRPLVDIQKRYSPPFFGKLSEVVLY